MEGLLAEIERLPPVRIYGRVAGIQGLLVTLAGFHGTVSIGSRCEIAARGGKTVPVEVVGFREGLALAMPYGSLDGVGLGARAVVVAHDAIVHPHATWLGRVIDAFGNPLDEGAPLAQGPAGYPLRTLAPLAGRRRRLRGEIDLGVRSINAFTTRVPHEFFPWITVGPNPSKGAMMTGYDDCLLKAVCGNYTGSPPENCVHQPPSPKGC